MKLTKDKLINALKGMATLVIPFGIAFLVFNTMNKHSSTTLEEIFISSPEGIHELTWDTLQTQQELIKNNSAENELISLARLQLQAVRESSRTSIYENTENILKFIRQKSPDDPAALAIEVQIDLARHHFEDAAQKSKQLTSNFPGRAEYFGLLTDSLIELGKYEEAIESLDTMISIKPDINTYTRAAYLREIYGDRSGAIELMEKAIINSSDVAENNAWNYSELGRLWVPIDREKSKASYQLSSKVYPGFVFAQEGLAKHLIREGKEEEALKLLEETLKRTPLPQIAKLMGEIYESKGDKEKAEIYYRLVEIGYDSIEASGTEVKMERARFHIEKSRNIAQAVEVMEEIIKTMPTIFNHAILAEGYQKLGNKEKSDYHLKQALRTVTDSQKIKK